MPSQRETTIEEVVAVKKRSHSRSDALLLAIALFKFVKGAVLFLTEGPGLLFGKRWAEWLTISATRSLMPLELYELIQKFTAVRLIVLPINAAIVLFLIYRVRQKEGEQPETFVDQCATVDATSAS